MTADIKLKIPAFLLLAAIAVILFASALPQLELKPGIPLPAWENGSGTPSLESAPIVAVSVNTLVKGILGVIAGLLLAFGVLKLIQGVSWKESLGEILRFSPFIAVLVLIGFGLILALMRVRITSQPSETEILPPVLERNGPPLGLPPTPLIWLVWIALGAVFILFAIWVVYWRTRQSEGGDPLKLEAERAMEALRTGLDLRNVIIRCYHQMSRALQKEQGIEREETMTAREFERLLQARGIPYRPVHELTLLFEVARYGDRPLSAKDEQTALDCLNAIVQSGGERKEAG